MDNANNSAQQGFTACTELTTFNYTVHMLAVVADLCPVLKQTNLPNCAPN